MRKFGILPKIMQTQKLAHMVDGVRVLRPRAIKMVTTMISIATTWGACGLSHGANKAYLQSSEHVLRNIYQLPFPEDQTSWDQRKWSFQIREFFRRSVCFWRLLLRRHRCTPTQWSANRPLIGVSPLILQNCQCRAQLSYGKLSWRY